MSADVDRIALTVEKAYEVVGGTIEVAIAIYLLARQTGWACTAPLIIAGGKVSSGRTRHLVLSLTYPPVSTAGNSTIAKLIPSRLKQWNQATQERVALTSTVLRNMRSIKMMGMTWDIAGTIRDSRTHELERSAHFRWFVAFMNLFGTLPKLLSAPFAFALFVFSAQFFSEGGLSAARAFTTLSLLELLTTPMGKVLQSLPHLTAAFGCMDRIEAYLLLDEQPDVRLLLSPPSPPPSEQNQNSASEKDGTRTITATAQVSTPAPAVRFINVALLYKPDAAPIIRDANFEIEEGSLVMIVGPVGCGKTTLLRAMVGELAPSQGSLTLTHTEIAYCAQTPWLTNATVRKNVIGQSPEGDLWYRTVITACALDQDIATFPDGDEQIIGSGGIALSGGQKQRLVGATS
jgi:ABC-type bacteriocin/lantibiotic exporter with double-glycine peptidase domain